MNGIISNMSGLYLCIILLLYISQVVCLKCLSCMNVVSPTDCAYIEECGSHSECYMDVLLTPVGEVQYNLGCRDSQSCIVARPGRRRNSVPMVWTKNINHALMDEVTQTRILNISNGKTTHTKRQTNYNVLCSTCCHGDNLCNNKGCNHPGYPLKHGPICYNCEQQVSETSCNQIKECGRDEMCFIEEITISGFTLYHTKCKGAVACRDTGLTQPVIQPTIIGRNVVYDFNVTATATRTTKSTGECCDKDLCNTFLPESGNWGPWMSWSGCSTSCGYNGVQRRTRSCGYPSLNNVGHPCVGNSTEIDTTCANKPCNHGLTCLSCSSSILPRTCNVIETCGPNSVCYLERYVSRNGNTNYRSGCRDVNQCNDVRPGKRFLENGDILACTDCCPGNLCNRHGCSTLPHYAESGPVCYSCDQQTDPITCDRISVCQKGQVCGVKKLPFTNVDIYQTMCLNPEQCQSHSITDNIYPKCCTTSLCGFPNQVNMLSTSQTPAITPAAVTIATNIATKPSSPGPTLNGCTPPYLTITQIGRNGFLHLSCNTTGLPLPTATWRVYKDRLDGVSILGSSIFIGPLDQHLLGVYKCTAENPCGTVEQNFTLSHIDPDWYNK